MFDPESQENYVPYVVETSIGLDRLFLAVLSHSLMDETLEDGSVRTVLRLPQGLAPTQAAILPLLKKDGLPEKAREILNSLKLEFQVAYDEKDAIGKRYRRHDAIGTPFCVTVDHQTLEDNTVTLRDRDSMEQTRIAIDEVATALRSQATMASLLTKAEA